jgi:hypothetical protein
LSCALRYIVTLVVYGLVLRGATEVRERHNHNTLQHNIQKDRLLVPT